MSKRGIMNKKTIISLSLIAILFFDLIPFVFAAGGGGTHVLQELPPTIIYQDDGVGYIKVKRTAPGQLPSASDPGAVAYEARSVDTKQGVNSVVISGTNIKAPTVDATSLFTKTLQSEYWSVAPSFYTKSLVLWDADSSGGVYKTVIEDPNPYSRTGFRIDTQGGTVSSGSVSSSSVVANYISTGATGVTISGKDVTVPSGGGVTLGGERRDRWLTEDWDLRKVTAKGAITPDSITTGGLTANGALTVTGTTTLAGLSASSASISGNTRISGGSAASGVRGIQMYYDSSNVGWVVSDSGSGTTRLVLYGNPVQIGAATPRDLYVTGNIGIGTTGSAYKLDVSGNARISSDLLVDKSQGITFSDNFRLATGSTYDDNWLRLLQPGSTNSNDYVGDSRNGGLAASNLWAKNDIYLGAKGKWLSETGAGKVIQSGVFDNVVLNQCSRVGGDAWEWGLSCFCGQCNMKRLDIDFSPDFASKPALVYTPAGDGASVLIREFDNTHAVLYYIVFNSGGEQFNIGSFSWIAAGS